MVDMEAWGLSACPTLVGSLPHPDPETALDRILDTLSELPAWPQLPCRNFRESMYVQCSEAFPGAVVDSESERIYFRSDERFHEELEGFYQAIIDDSVDHFAISPDYALGFHLFLDRMRSGGSPGPRWLKGQVTGPFSFAMTVTDENKRAMAYNPELFEVAVQGIAMKARWSARKLCEVADGALVVLDEPYLCSFGSAFVNVERKQVVAAIRASVDAIHKEGALAGLHCCGNTDWSLALETGTDVLNPDAFKFFDGLPLYPAEVKSFLDRGGIVAFGIVPSSEAALDVTGETLMKDLDSRVDQLAAKGIDRTQLFRQSLITPACGMGTKTVEVADRVLDLLRELSQRLRKRDSF
jgi:methionine synthase II (cobalamin-independent)